MCACGWCIGASNSTHRLVSRPGSRHWPPVSSPTWFTCLRAVPVTRLSSWRSLLRRCPLRRQSAGQLQALSVCFRTHASYATAASTTSWHPLWQWSTACSARWRTTRQCAHSTHGHRRRLLWLHRRPHLSSERRSWGFLFSQRLTQHSLLLHTGRSTPRISGLITTHCLQRRNATTRTSYVTFSGRGHLKFKINFSSSAGPTRTGLLVPLGPLVYLQLHTSIPFQVTNPTVASPDFLKSKKIKLCSNLCEPKISHTFDTFWNDLRLIGEGCGV